MRNKRSHPITWLMICGVCHLICGCQDAIKDGFTNGIESGISTIVASLLEEAVDDTRGQ